MARKLKVFSADLGFVRAVVAAPSRKAALDAWGVRDDLFAHGAAQEITDDQALMDEASARPGEVLRKPVASGADLLAAAMPKPGARTKAAPAGEAPAPPPSRTALEKAETGLKVAKAARLQALKAFDTERAALEARRAAEEAKQDEAVARLQTARDAAKAAYEKAVKAQVC